MKKTWLVVSVAMMLPTFAGAEEKTATEKKTVETHATKSKKTVAVKRETSPTEEKAEQPAPNQALENSK